MSTVADPFADTRPARIAALRAALAQRIVVLDGAMGTMIQKHKLAEADFRGARFHNWPQDLQGNNDLLSITRPDIIRDIHVAYLRAGADLAETNTFSSTTIAQADYAMADIAFEMNVESARLARAACDAVEAEDGRPRWVAGAIGPTNRTASISPDVNDPGARNVTFDELRAAYADAARALIEGGTDVLLVETVFDTLNAKAALFGIDEVLDAYGGIDVPVIVSGTITDLSGRTLSGQTTEAFWNSVRHARPLVASLNCALGAKELRAYVAELSRVAETFVGTYPNAGLPNEFGEYDEAPEAMAAHIGGWAREGLVNLVGGCCGTTPPHIQAIAEAVAGVAPRPLPDRPTAMRLSGLEPFEVSAA